MKRSVAIALLLVVFCLYNVSYSIGIVPSPGTRVWDIARQDNMISNTIESKVSELTVDFTGTFTVLDIVLSKVSLTEGQATTLESQLNDLQVDFAIDLSKVCAIENNLNTIQLNLESIDTAGTFTALDALKQTVCSKIELLNNQLNEVQSDITDLTVTEIDHAATIASQLDVLDQEVVSINSILDIVNFDFQFNTACSVLDLIDGCLQTVESKVDLLEAPVEIGFAGTFTALDSNLQKACTIESLVDAIPMSFMADLSGTFSALNQLQQKICTIDSKVDEIDMSIMSVESDVDILDTTLDSVVSKLCILESKTSMMVDGSSFSLFDNAIQELDQECSILEILNNNILLEKACTIESNIDVVTHELLTQESRLDIIDQDVQTVASKVCAIQMDDTAISKLCLVDSKLDIEFDAALTIESLIDVIDMQAQTVDSKIDLLISQEDLLESKLCDIEAATMIICSNLDLLLSNLDITESKLDLLIGPAPGSLCLDFGTGGLVSTDFPGGGPDGANAVVLQPDGKIIAVGNAQSGGNNEFGLARYNSDGSLDATFGTGGLVTTGFPGGGPDEANAAVLQPDGKIIAAGQARMGGNNEFALARYNSDGSLDPTFGTGGLVTTDLASGNNDFANAVVLQPDGKIIAAGQARVVNNESFGLARYNSDGSLDSTFGTGGIVITTISGGIDRANAVVLQPDGKIIAVGQARVGGNNDFALLRYNSDGSLDATFGTGGLVTTGFPGGGPDEANAAVLQPDGKIIAVGRANVMGNNNFALARYNSDGSLDGTFGTGGLVTTAFSALSDFANAVVLQPDGKIIAVGQGRPGGDPDFALARYNSNGSLDSTFGTGGLVTTDFFGGIDLANAALLQSDGKIIAVGSADVGGNTNFALACYESGLLPIWFVKQEVELLCDQLEKISTPTLVSKICLIEDQVCTIESTLDVVGPLIGMLNMQAQELMGDFQETWTILQVIEDKICISESLLDDAQTILDQLDLSGAFTPIEAIDQKAFIVDGEVNTYESLVDALDVDFSGVFTALGAIESKICLADDFVQSISAGLEIVQDALGIPIFQSDLGTTGFVVPAPGRYYLAEDIVFTPTAAFTAAIFIDGIDDVTIDLNDRVLELSDTATTNIGHGISVVNADNIRVLNGTVNNFADNLVDFVNCTNVIASGLNVLNAQSKGGFVNTIGISLDRFRNVVVKDCVAKDGQFAGVMLSSRASTVIARNALLKNIYADRAATTFFGRGVGTLQEGATGLSDQVFNVCIQDVRAVNNSPHGILCYLNSNYAILNCAANNNSIGIRLLGLHPNFGLANNADIKGCVANDNLNRGIMIGTTNGSAAFNNCTVMHNTAIGNASNGILLDREGSGPPVRNNYIAFNNAIENSVNIVEDTSTGANTYLGNFAFNSTAVGDPDNANYTISGGSDITRKFVTVSQTSSFTDRPTEWHNINMLP